MRILIDSSSPLLLPFVISLVIIVMMVLFSFVYFGAIAIDYVYSGFFLSLLISTGVSALIQFFKSELRSKDAAIEQLSNTDPLTGLTNRRHFFELARHEFQLAKRENNSLCMVLITLDNLSEVNNQSGQLRGDQLLNMLAVKCKDVLRANDLLARYSGNEFVILLYGCLESHTDTVISRLKEQVSILNRETIKFNMRADIELKATCLTKDISTFDDLIKALKGQITHA
ncbi:MAG: GGDEF domain-containing protein [Gammaproteobacteria bacterium]|nr:GGDEF domain-containing protein [Gammaproteobacteria bacterium]MDH5693172.1 GGDEF domain-containing protein [Gammaproteobacteria bacterium]